MENNKSEDNCPDPDNRVLLEETFYVLSKRNCVFRVKLTAKGLHLFKETEISVKEQIIPVRDIVGGRCLRRQKPSSVCSCHSLPINNKLRVVEETSNDLDEADISAYLYIYAYTLRTNGSNSRHRERTVITLRFRSFDRYEDNNKEAQRWRLTIKHLIQGEQITPGQILDNIVNKQQKDNRQLLVLCNPKSGVGKAKHVFQHKVVPILEEGELPYDLHITKHANFAREFIRTVNVFQWTGIIVVGGDGLLFEVINGIFERSDWSDVLKAIPIGVIPCGSGNGLAHSISYYTSQMHSPTSVLSTTLAAVHNNFTSMDLVRVETTSAIMFSFLSVGWGFISDIDVESERLRMLGGKRFTLWSIARLVGLRSYGGKLWYLPIQNSTNRPSSRAVQTTTIYRDAAVGDSVLDLTDNDIQLETQTGRQRLDSWYSAVSRPSAYFSITGSSYQSTADSDGPTTPTDGTRTANLSQQIYGPASQLPSLTAPILHEQWICVEGRFLMVHASYQSHLGEGCLIAPEATLNDGIIWLLIVHGGTTRNQLLHFLLGLKSGAHATRQHPDGLVELIPVRAFRIEPDMNEEHSYMTVDGECVDYGPIQAEIFPQLGRIMVP